MDVRFVGQLAATYQLAPPVSLHPLTGGTNNASYRVTAGRARFVLKRYLTYDDRATVAYEHHLLRWLDAQPRSFAVPVPLPDRHGDTVVSIDGAPCALFRWLPGTQPQPTAAQVEAFGAALGELHATLVAYPRAPRPGVFPYGDLARIHPLLSDPARLDAGALALPQRAEAADLLRWWEQEIAALRTFVEGPYRTLPWQLIHGDSAFVNALFRGEQLTALLDFEFAAPDARALDLAAALRSLLRRQDPALFASLSAALLRGYQRSNALTAEEGAALPTLMRLSSAISTLWWLGRDLAAGDPSKALSRLTLARQQALYVRL